MIFFYSLGGASLDRSLGYHDFLDQSFVGLPPPLLSSLLLGGRDVADILVEEFPMYLGFGVVVVFGIG